MNTPNIRKQTLTTYTEFPVRSFLLYGEPKTGKTTTAAQFPLPLILNTLSENGTGEIAGDVLDMATPQDLINYCAFLRTDVAKEYGYQTVVLDGLSTFVLDEISRHPSRDQRKSVKEATAVLIPALHQFLSLPLIRVLTAHSKRENEELRTDEGTVQKDSIFPDLPPRLRLFIEGRVDAFGYCFAGKDGKSKIWWTPLDQEKPKHRSIAAGNRLGLVKATDLSFEAIRAALLNGHTKE